MSTVENGDVTGRVISGALKVHSTLGPWLLESAYGACLAHELRRRGVQVRSEVELPVLSLSTHRPQRLRNSCRHLDSPAFGWQHIGNILHREDRNERQGREDRAGTVLGIA